MPSWFREVFGSVGGHAIYDAIAAAVKDKSGEVATAAIGRAGKTAKDVIGEQEGREEVLAMIENELPSTFYGWPKLVPDPAQRGKRVWVGDRPTPIDQERARVAKVAWDSRFEEARKRGRLNWVVNRVAKRWRAICDDQVVAGEEPNRNRMLRELVELAELPLTQFWERLERRPDTEWKETVGRVARSVGKKADAVGSAINRWTDNVRRRLS